MKREGRSGSLCQILVRSYGKKIRTRLKHLVIPDAHFPDDIYTRPTDTRSGFRFFPDSFDPPFLKFSAMEKSICLEGTELKHRVTFDTEDGFNRNCQPITRVLNIKILDSQET